MVGKLKVVIIDDEELSVDTSVILLKEYCPNVEVIGVAFGVNEGCKLLKTCHPDLVLLDIEMGDGTGFDLLEQLGDISFQVVFVTAYDQYAIKAFEYNAISYLLKPYPVESLKAVVDKAFEPMAKAAYMSKIENLLEQLQGGERLQVASQKGFENIKIGDILFMEADSNYTTIALSSGEKLLTSKTLKFYQQQLVQNDFFRCHHSYLVPKLHIKEIDTKSNKLVLVDGSIIPVSTRKMKNFKDWYAS